MFAIEATIPSMSSFKVLLCPVSNYVLCLLSYASPGNTFVAMHFDTACFLILGTCKKKGRRKKNGRRKKKQLRRKKTDDGITSVIEVQGRSSSSPTAESESELTMNDNNNGDVVDLMDVDTPSKNRPIVDL
jgi:hypothetical protein